MTDTATQPEPGTLEHPEGEPVLDVPDESDTQPVPLEGPGGPQETDGDEAAPEQGDEPAAPRAPDDEPEAPVSPVPGKTPEALDKLRRDLDKSAATWRKRVETLLGDDFEALTVCELCAEVPGFHWPAELLQPETELEARLIEVLRGPAAPEYLPAQTVAGCTACNGYGKVSTGSRVPGKGVVNCAACKGFGYTPPPGGVMGDAGGPSATDELPPLDDPEAPPAESDPWGSPRILADGQENPNYGRMPQYKDASLP